MSTELTHKYNKLATALLLLAPFSAVHAAAPVFVENSVLNNELEFMFNPKTGNSEHLSMAIDSNNSIYTSYQNAIGSADIVNVAQYTAGQVTALGEQSTVATGNTYTQIRVNPIDGSLVLAFVEDSKLIIRTSTDGQDWQQVAETAVTATSKSVKMEVDSQGTAYVLHTGSDNKTTVYKFTDNGLNIVYGPVATKSNNNFTVAADIAINSTDQLYFVYRDFAAGATKNKTLLVSWDDNDVQQTPLLTSGAPTGAYMKVAFDSMDNLHLFNVGYSTAAGGAVYKLDGTDLSDTTWQQVGDKNFGFTFAQGHESAPTTGTGSPVLDLAFGSDDVPYVAFQQMNNATASKKHAQMASLIDDVWTEIPYDLATVTKNGSNPDNANHNFLDIAIDDYDRPLLVLRSSGTGHNSWGYTLRVNLAASDETIAFSVNEGNVSVGQIIADDAESDAITLSLSGTDAELFNIEQSTGNISFKEAQTIADADHIYNLIVSATAASETTNANVQVTLINDASNDVQDSDGDGVDDNDDAFPNDPAESADSDGDGVGDNADAFPNDANETTDTDGDGVGDNSDYYPNDATRSVIEDNDGDGIENAIDADDDNDGVLDVDDRFPFDASESVDADNDGTGDNADPDDDNDGVLDVNDAFPFDASESVDSDGDGVGDNTDAYPNDPSRSVSEDFDNDGLANEVDPDDDNDGVLDVDDAFPMNANESADNDGDGEGDNADLDDDNDGVADTTDAFPLDPAESLDSDLDGIGNNADLDDDNDGVVDSSDAFPLDPTESLDSDLDGTGNNADLDDDNDGVADSSDAFPLDPAESLDNDLDGIGNNADLDDDNDGVSDVDDVFPLDATESEDSDLDGIGNNADLDDDNDGVNDSDDAFPFDASESADSDGDGVGDNADAFPFDASETKDSDGDGFGDNIDPNPFDQNDLTAPVFAEDIAAIVVPAMGLMTNVERAIIEANIVANDLFDGDIAAQIETTELVFSSGKHLVEMSATDTTGNKSVKDITLEILPIFSVSQSLTASAGATLSIPVNLSGVAANYPVDISYSVTGPTTISTGVITFVKDKDQTSLSLSVDASAVDGDEILVSFNTSANAVVNDNTQVMVVVDNENNAPLLTLATSQAEQSISVVSPTQGLVTITANINDLNVDDTHAVSFDVIGAEFADQMLDDQLQTFEFDPAMLESGSYQVKVSVIETNTPELLETTIYSNIVVDSDLTEVQVDSDQDGIVDSLDTDNNPSRLPIAATQQPMQVSTGLTLALGDIAQTSDDAQGASIDADAIETDYHFTTISTITNFIVNGLSDKGGSAAIVLPLAQDETILEDSVYRKYSPAKGWFNFVEDESNSLASAAKDAVGNCPTPYSSEYYEADGVTANGLVAGFDCIQLTIADGGANDADEMTNGTIADPGALVMEHDNNLPEILAYDAAAISGQPVVLEASADDADFDQIQFNWLQLTGPTVAIADADLAAISFAAPDVDSVTELMFEVTADDGRDVVSSIVTLTVTVIETKPDEDLHRHSGSFGWLMLMFGGLLIGRRKIKQ